jgi:glycosyltransferase involved in cell wall biosynthesis
MRITAVVPVFYEEPRLADTLARLAALRDGLDLEIVVVVDVPDPLREGKAREANDEAARSSGATVLYRIGERGFGSALRFGFARASGEAVLPFMGDCSDDPQDIPRMVGAMEAGLDVVAGSRYMNGGAVIGMTAKQRVSRLYSRLVRAVGGPPVHDVSNAFKLYRRDLVERADSVADSFDVSVELTVKAAASGARIGELPTTWRNRDQGTSHFAFRDELPRYWRWLAYTARNRGRIRRAGPTPTGTASP